jgi:hypothetical protein
MTAGPIVPCRTGSARLPPPGGVKVADFEAMGLFMRVTVGGN